ncbi:hypothetical protein MMC22_011854 [Lobaria immixta]|nr:hypothetical protein [Lobaria immixta]
MAKNPLGYDIDDSLQRYVGRLIRLAGKESKDLNPALEQFRALVEGDDTLRTLSSQMFGEVPTKPSYNRDPTSQKSQVRGFSHLLQFINHILMRAPEWDADANKIKLAASPICAIMDWPMGTASGGAFFPRHDVNQQLAKILNSWSEYLSSKDSANVLDEGGWFGKDGMNVLTTRGNVGETHYTFDRLTAAPHYGFTSWDDFFIRRFKPGVRLDTAPEGGPPDPNIPDPTAIIVAACKAVPVCLVRHVQARDAFWLKGQPYSIPDMLSKNDLASDFAGETVYQAFLSPVTYHQWHSPGSGIASSDPAPPDCSQYYLASSAICGLVFIQAQNWDIGLMFVTLIGMNEVSTCEIAVKPGQYLTKGDDIGTFHFGESTYCMVFKKEVDLLLEPFEINAKHNTPVLSMVAIVKPKSNGMGIKARPRS